jgi:hypothetical protein
MCPDAVGQSRAQLSHRAAVRVLIYIKLEQETSCWKIFATPEADKLKRRFLRHGKIRGYNVSDRPGVS